jgi:hypothetical protein
MRNFLKGLQMKIRGESESEDEAVWLPLVKYMHNVFVFLTFKSI